jgi:lactate dehydrogenase-like 2-hydroxyacid dehydrogenase
MKPELLFKVAVPDYRGPLAEVFTIIDYPPMGALPDVDVCRCARVLVTTGFTGASRSDMEALPALSLICCVGTGYENVDIVAARERGIVVVHGAGTNAGAVADHAFALLLAVMRDIPRFDASARHGDWRGALRPRPTPSGKRLGIIGMGGIGERVARRAAAFDMVVSYHTRTQRPNLPWRHFTSALALAEAVDCLIVAAPGGSQTFHMIDTAVLRALGPDGFLVNVGRGSIVDTAALVEALRAGTIAGAALDVFEDEPLIPEDLRTMPNIVMTPHVAAFSPEVQSAGVLLLQRNIELFLGGEPVLTPVPELTARTIAVAGTGTSSTDNAAIAL